MKRQHPLNRLGQPSQGESTDKDDVAESPNLRLCPLNLRIGSHCLL